LISSPFSAEITNEGGLDIKCDGEKTVFVYRRKSIIFMAIILASIASLMVITISIAEF
jgi:hypothetical protein